MCVIISLGWFLVTTSLLYTTSKQYSIKKKKIKSVYLKVVVICLFSQTEQQQLCWSGLVARDSDNDPNFTTEESVKMSGEFFPPQALLAHITLSLLIIQMPCMFQT